MNNTDTGVIFKDSDYASFFIRAIIIFIDIVFLILLLIPSVFLDDFLYQGYYVDDYVVTKYVFSIVPLFYLTVLKSSKFGTLGQKITKTKILHINGKRPSVFVMIYRLFFWGFGPLNFIADFAWMTLNKEKRTVRDSLSNTIVVKKEAKPISTDSKIRNVRVLFFGLNFLYSTAMP